MCKFDTVPWYNICSIIVKVKICIEGIILYVLLMSKESFSSQTLNWLSVCSIQCTALYIGYTHKTSGFKTSGFKTSGFKTSETSGLQNVWLTKCLVYKTLGRQKKHPDIFCTRGRWKSAGSVAAIFAGKVMAVFCCLF